MTEAWTDEEVTWYRMNGSTEAVKRWLATLEAAREEIARLRVANEESQAALRGLMDLLDVEKPQPDVATVYANMRRVENALAPTPTGER